MATKVCTRCNIEKDSSQFYKHKTNADRLRNDCKPCFCIITRKDNEDLRRTPSGRARGLLADARVRAAKKNLPFTITRKWVADKIASGFCSVTGLPFEIVSGEGGNGRSFTPSLDRIDPNLGYTFENTQVVCWIYNRAKGVQGHEDVMKMCGALCK